MALPWPQNTSATMHFLVTPLVLGRLRPLANRRAKAIGQPTVLGRLRPSSVGAHMLVEGVQFNHVKGLMRRSQVAQGSKKVNIFNIFEVAKAPLS